MQIGLVCLLAATAILLLRHAWQRSAGQGRPTTEVESAVYLIDLNKASQAELSQLPGIGDVMARRIVDYRQSRPPFASVDDLEGVRGIGPKVLERLRPRVFVATDATQPKSTLQAASPDELRPSSKKAAPDKLVDLNRAGRDELMQLPGIGPVLAERIVADRTRNGLYQTPDDLKRVRGIKDKMLEKISPFIKVELADSASRR